MSPNTAIKSAEKWISPLERIGYARQQKRDNMPTKNLMDADLQPHLEILWDSFCTGIRSKKAERPKQWLEAHGLDFKKLDLGFNSGQFHHRRDDKWRAPYIDMGILTPSDAPVNRPDRKAYTCFGTYGVVFPIKDQTGRVINLYAVRINLEDEQHLYLNEEGIYPEYPSQLTKTLYVTTTVMEAASIIQADVLEPREAVIALQNGEWLPQHEQVIKDLPQLEQVILLKN